MEKLVVGYSLKKEGVYLLVSIFMWLIVGLIAIIFIIILSTIRFSLNRFKATNVDNMNIAPSTYKIILLILNSKLIKIKCKKSNLNRTLKILIYTH